MSPSHEVRLRRQMSLSAEEFLRSLPAALSGERYTIRGGDIFIGDDQRHARITLVAQTARQLGSLRLPVLEVTFVFTGYEQGEREEFLRRFNRAFQRGGG